MLKMRKKQGKRQRNIRSIRAVPIFSSCMFWQGARLTNVRTVKFTFGFFCFFLLPWSWSAWLPFGGPRLCKAICKIDNQREQDYSVSSGFSSIILHLDSRLHKICSIWLKDETFSLLNKKPNSATFFWELIFSTKYVALIWEAGQLWESSWKEGIVTTVPR